VAVSDKVIYISVMRLSEKVARDWFVDFLIENGIDVEFWDVATVVYGRDGHESMTADYLRVPKSYTELEGRLFLPENRNATYIMLATYESRTVNLFRTMTRSNCRLVHISWGAMPGGHTRRLIRGLDNPAAFALNAARRAKAGVYRRLNLVKRFDIVFAAGEVLVAASTSTKCVVPINLVDYDHYRSSRLAAERLIENSYAVFLDIFLPYQSDLKIVGMQAVDADSYYASLTRYFDRVEQLLDVEVVIAAHPKSNYSSAQFGGRRMLRGLTPELVRDAKVVLSHHSTSISYAILNRKPIVFIYTDEMLELYEMTIVDQIRGLAAYLNSPVQNIDRFPAGGELVVPVVDEARFDAFKYDFLTTHASEHDSSRDIFLREITRVTRE
jgi:hypothetical protein